MVWLLQKRWNGRKQIIWCKKFTVFTQHPITSEAIKSRRPKWTTRMLWDQSAHPTPCWIIIIKQIPDKMLVNIWSRPWITTSYSSNILYSADLITGNLYSMHHFHCFTPLNLTFSAKQLKDDAVVTWVRSVLEVPVSDLGRNAGHNTRVFRSVPQYFQANVHVLPQNMLSYFSSASPNSP
jgi:hypothetical protein